MIKKIHIDLGTVTTRDDLFRIFAVTFSFPSYFGNNWDAFFDVMYSLDPDMLTGEDMVGSLTGVHLIFLNFDIFQNVFPETEMNRFCSVLVDLSANKEYR